MSEGPLLWTCNDCGRPRLPNAPGKHVFCGVTKPREGLTMVVGEPSRFVTGMRIVFARPWYVRAWQWIKFKVLRRPRMVLTVVKVDHGAGSVTVDAGTERP